MQPIRRRTPSDRSTRRFPAPIVVVLLLAALFTGSPRSALAQSADLARQVEVVRTTYGVPHIRAENFRAAGYAMGYVQMEDYGYAVVRRLIGARGEMGLHLGRDSMEADFGNRLTYLRALETYHLLEQDTRDLMEGFAIGVNRYVELHPGELPDWVRPGFTGTDVHALGIGNVRPGSPRRFLERLGVDTAAQAAMEAEGDPEDGSNAWALAPSRTRSGAAILLRNPHLSWSAGYYEAQVTVPGVMDFYGDFRIGGPLGIVGGFNRHLGWATTNNSPDLDEIYALEADPDLPDHYLFDDRSVPLTRAAVTVEFRDGAEIGQETRTFWSSPLGSVVHRDGGTIYVVRSAGHGEYRTDEQFLKMMRATSLEEWQEAVKMRARTSSNLTYADADGNIFYVWNATVPELPLPSGGDTVAVPATRGSDVWTRAVAFERLPQLRNPRGGYVRNENDPPYFTNARQPLDPARYPENIRENALRLRSQHSLELLNGDEKFTLEDVVRMKHSMRMLLADRVKHDLILAVRGSHPGPEVARAIDHLEAWDNTVAAESRGGVLFQTWWERYVETAPRAAPSAAAVGFRAEADALFRQPWTADRPLETPRGLADPARAAEAFAWAVEETTRRHGSWDLAWGDVHRVRRGDVDVPVGGCSGLLGCFRVLSFREADDGKQVAVGGDGWVLAVEFTDPVRAYSVLAYGQSNREDSPHFDDQAELFARNEMKPVAFTPEDVERQAIRRYRPGAGGAAAAVERRGRIE
jgi:acyl-homoserine-lactone acylase